ncbi:MAG: hypothetical protein ACYDER_17120 [Ktedonobacteraceae bacterium]
MTQRSTDQPRTGQPLSIFATTADQRYLLGADLFMRTHYPVSLCQYRRGTLLRSLREEDLLEQLLESSALAPGNRLWVVYGAPGSGKSELMRWLESRILQEDVTRAAVMVRLSRTELDVLSITERFRTMLSPNFYSETMRSRWYMARQKPRTLAKLILLFALESLLDSDELINALFYRLLNAVQPQIERILATGEEAKSPGSIELMSLEVWETIIRETAIPVPLEYERFRHQMTLAFSQHLLEGLSLPDTLHRVSSEISERSSLRPILLIDDLVQSLNVFASDLLDYFITLEEGNWDVVIGLTPAAFEASQRGRLLLQRIAYLDTVDDRVEKLWLSDEAGYDSYVLEEENCHDFAARYLCEYHRLSGLVEIEPLYPFNREALVRIYRGLPTGKGKIRYFLRHLRYILEGVERGESLLSAVAKFARYESVARCEDRDLAAICELYGPLIQDSSTYEITLSRELLQFFGRADDAIVIPVEPLMKSHLHFRTSDGSLVDEEKVAVRDWLLGRDVNRQLLRRLRQGATRLLRAISSPTAVHHPGVARPHGILNWQKPCLDVHPPINLEGVDECDGIVFRRAIGQVAFDVYRYAHAMGTEARELGLLLLNEPRLLPFFFDASNYYKKVVNSLEMQLGISLEKLALSMYVWRQISAGGLPDEISLFPVHIKQEVVALSNRTFIAPGARQEAYRKECLQFFEDFFKLRENLFDGPRLALLCENRSAGDILGDILSVDPAKVGTEFRWGKRPLQEVLLDWQEIVEQGLAPYSAESLPPILQRWINRLDEVGGKGISFSEIPIEVITTLIHDASFATRLRVSLDG